MLIIIGVLIVALAVSGCGSGSSPSSGSSPGSTSSSESTTASAKPGESKSEESGESNGSTESGEIPPSATPLSKPPAKVEIPTGLETKGQVATKEIKGGVGATAKAGDEVTVQYVGFGVKSKKKFDSSWERGEPLSFTLGAGEVIEGWDQGLEGMKVGGRRELYVPAKLAYGSEGTASIKPNEDIVFVVDLLAVKSGA